MTCFGGHEGWSVVLIDGVVMQPKEERGFDKDPKDIGLRSGLGEDGAK